MKTLSPETIRFRLWQLRLSFPDILQIEAAIEIGCTVEALRAAKPDGWKHRGGGRPEHRPESVACDDFARRPAFFLASPGFRSEFTVINGSLL